MFLVLSLFFGVLFVFLTPPFQVPDEPAHFLRAYAISEGNFRARTWGGVPAQSMPVSMPQFALELTGSRIGDQRAKISFDDIFSTLRYRLEPDRRVLMVLPLTPSGPVAFSAAGYVPLAYTPAAVSMAVGRWLDLPVLLMFYAARLANLLAATALCWLAVRITPVGKRILAATALLPMAAFLRSSTSPDGLLIALGLLAFALALASALEGRRGLPALLAVSFILVASKPIYLFMPLLAMVIVDGTRRSTGRRVTYAAAGLLTAAVALGVAGWWVVAPLEPAEPSASELSLSRMEPQLPSANQGKTVASSGELNIQEQARGVFQSPVRFVSIIASEYWSRLPALSYQFVGRFAWLDTPLPLTARMLFLGMLFLLALTDARPGVSLTFGQRSVLATIFVGTLIVAAGILYLSWTPLGATYIEGIQGRYFIPVAPAALLLLTNSMLSNVFTTRRLTMIMTIIAALTLTIAAWSMFSRFYGHIPSPMMYMASSDTAAEPYTDIDP